MVNGPPCGICGFTLRWLPQQSSWGCDRCQRMFPASGPGAPQQHQAQQPSPWAPPNPPTAPPTSPQSPHAMPGFTPPQQQGFGAPPSRPQQQGFAPPQQQGFAPPQQQGFAPPQQQGFQPGGSYPGASHPNAHGAHPSHPPGANPYAPPGAHPSHPPGANPYAPPGAHPSQPPGANPYAPPGAQAAHPGAYGQQPQPYSPHPATPAPGAPPVAGKKSSKGLLIGLGVAGVVIAGGVVAFVVMRGGGGTAGGGSRNDVVKSTLAALGDGDVDQLLRLSDIPGLHEKVVDCSGKTKALEKGEDDDQELSEKDKEDRDPKKQVEKRKKEYEEVAPLTKGAKIELVEIVTKEPPAPKDDEKSTDDEDDPLGGVMKTGQKLMKGCVAKVPMRIHQAKLKLKVTPKGEAAIEQDAEIMLLQVGTGFYLAAPPTVSLGAGALEREFNGIKDKVCACKDAECAQKLKDEFKASPRRKAVKKEIKALSERDKEKIDAIEDEIRACEKKLGGEDQLEAMEQFKDKLCACNDKICADKVTQEMTVWGNSNKDSKLSDEDMKKAADIGDEMGKCITRIYSADTGGGGGGGGIGATIASAGGLAEASADLPQQCLDYREILLKSANCPKLPQQSRQALLDGWKAMADGWSSIDFKTLPPASLKAIEDGCKQGVDAMKQAMATLGC